MFSILLYNRSLFILLSLASLVVNPYSLLDIFNYYICIVMSSIQQTLVVLKPDAVGRTIVGDIITRFERVGLSLVGMKLTHADKKLLHDHYEGIGKLGSRRGENVLDIVIKMMNQ